MSDDLFELLGAKPPTSGNAADDGDDLFEIAGIKMDPRKPQGIGGWLADAGLDILKRAGGAAISGVASMPDALQSGARATVRQGATGDAATVMPASVFMPGIDTDEAINGPMTDAQRGRQELRAERMAAGVRIPGAAASAKLGKDTQEAINATTSQATRDAVANSQITGNLLKGEIDFGKDPSVRGFLMQGADVFGSMAPVVATALITKSPGAAGAVGGAMAGGEGVQNARDFIAKQTHEQLLENSPLYKRMIDAGAPPQEARGIVSVKAEDASALLQGAVAAVGDRFTGKLVTGGLDPLIGRMAGKSVAGKTLAGGALSSAEEGTQELTEGLASDTGTKSVVGNKEIGEDSAANFVLGAIGGGAPGAVRGAVSGLRSEAAPAPAPDGGTPPTQDAPPAPGAEPESNPAPPIDQPAPPATGTVAADPGQDALLQRALDAAGIEREALQPGQSAAEEEAAATRLAELEVMASSQGLDPEQQAERETLAQRLEEIGAREAELETTGEAPGAMDAAAPTSSLDPNAAQALDGQALAATESGAPAFDPGAVQAKTWPQFTLERGHKVSELRKGTPAWDALQSEWAAVKMRRAGANPDGTGATGAATPEIQNRDRSRPASVVQMQAMAQNPDYQRLGISRSPESGAPMVFAVGDQAHAAQVLGAADVAVMSDGQRVPFQYAVMEAADVQPSNFADGGVNPLFDAAHPGTVKALNNGRTAGVRAAYERGTAEAYKQELMADSRMHGIDPAAIEGMRAPMLVRLYAEGDNRTNMGAKSQSQALGLSATEQAATDAALMDAGVLDVFGAGGLDSAGNRDFARAFMGKLQAQGQDVAGMMDANGALSPAGVTRLQAALVHKAYGDGDLVESMFGSTDTDIRAIGEALKDVAGEWANMRHAVQAGAVNPQVDLTGNLLQAIRMVQKARRERASLYDAINQVDMVTGDVADSLTVGVLRLLYSGQYLTRAVGRERLSESLREYMGAALATSAAGDMFGEQVGPDAILSALFAASSGQPTQQTNHANTQATRQSDPEPAQGERIAPGGNPAGGRADAPGSEAPGPQPSAAGQGLDQAGRSGPGQDAQDSSQQQDRPGDQGAGQDSRGAIEEEGAPPLELTAPTAADVVARQDEAAQEDKERAKDEAKAEADAKAELERKEVAARMGVNAENFELGQDAGDAVSGQGGLMFSRSVPKPQDFVPSPDGGLDYGEITPEMGRAMRRQAGAIRLQQGVQNADGSGHGLAHIEARHGKEIRAAGFDSVGEFVADVFQNMGQIWKPGATSQLIAVESGRTGKVAFIQLENDSQGGSDFYRVNSAFPANEKYVARKEKREGWEPLWSRYPVPADASGASGFAGQSPKAGETTPTVSSQSGSTSVPSKAPDAKFSHAPAADKMAPANAPSGASNARMEMAQSLVTGLSAKWMRMPEVIVARNMQDPQVPQRVRAIAAKLQSQGSDGAARGFIYKGKVYLLSDQLKSPQQIAEVLFHEVLGHYGLRGAFGDALAPILQQLGVARRKEVLAKAREYGMASKTLGDREAWAAMSAKDRELAAEEVLAEMAQSHPELGFVKRAIAAIRNWLRANVPGFKGLALTDADIIQNFILPARGFVTRSQETGEQSLERAMAAFSRDDDSSFDIRFSRAGPPQPQPPADPAPNLLSGLQSRVRDLTGRKSVDSWLYNWQDKFIDLKRIQDAIKALNGTVSDTNNAYRGEELYHKRVAKRTSNFLRDEVRPLIKRLNDAKVPIKDLEQFLHARHAPEANAAMAERNLSAAQLDAKRVAADQQVKDLRLQLQRAQAQALATTALQKALGQALVEQDDWKSAQAFKGTEEERLSLSGMSDQEAAAIMAALSPAQRATMDALAARVDAINAGTLKTLEDYGLMDRPTLNAWRNAYQHYVPLHRDEAHPDSTAHPIGQGFSVKGSASRQRTGSNEKVTNIFGHIMMQREAALTRGEKNNVTKKLYLLAAQNPDPDIWSLDLPKKKVLDPDTGLVRTMVDQGAKLRDNVVMVRIGGKDKFIVFNERNERAVRLAIAMRNLDANELDRFTRTMGRLTRWFSAVNTQYNPIFGVVNLARDTQATMLQLTNTPLAGKQGQVLKGIRANMASIYKDLRRERREAGSGQGPWGKLWEQMQLDGGTTGFRDLYANPEDRAEALQKALDQQGQSKTRALGREVMGWLSDFNETMEATTRLAVYKVALDSGIGRDHAASIAKNITVNFNRKGRNTSVAGSYYAFLNAAIQGNVRMLETLTGPQGRKIMAGGVMLGMLSSMAGASMMGGDGADDEWKKIPEFVKERSIIIPLGPKDYVAIPMPLGFHVFPNIGRKLVEIGMHDDPTTSRMNHVLDMAMIALNAYNPLGGSENIVQMLAPTPFDPVVSLMENKDWTGKSIYKEQRSALDPKPGHAMAKDSATPVSRWVARAINGATGGNEWKPGALSPNPDAIEYLFGQITGGVGREATKLGNMATSAYTGEELAPHQIVLAGRFYGNTNGVNGQSPAYYENLKRINTSMNEAKGRSERGEGVDAIFADVPLSRLDGPASVLDKRVQDLVKMRRRIQASDEPNKRELVKEVNGEMERSMRLLNQAVADALKVESER